MTTNAGWNDRYDQDIELAATHGMKFDLGMGDPHWGAGDLDQLIALVGGPLRNAVDALEAPNEYDIFHPGPDWSTELRGYEQQLYSKAKADSSLRSLPVYGPSLVLPGSASALGSLSGDLDRGNIHPYTGGEAPSQQRIQDAFATFGSVWGNKPVVATEAGFHNAMSAKQGQPPTPEDVAASYLLRTYLEHFSAGIRRTYAYELIDEKPDPGLVDPEQHFGLLRNDLSEKPAFVALRNMLSEIGRPGNVTARPLDYALTGDTGGVRQLLLQKTASTYVLALWQSASQWNTTTRQRIGVPNRDVQLTLPDDATATVARPTQGPDPIPAGTGTRFALKVPADPVLVELDFHGSPATGGRTGSGSSGAGGPTGGASSCPAPARAGGLLLRRAGAQAFVSTSSPGQRRVRVTLCAVPGGRARIEVRRTRVSSRHGRRVLALRRVRVKTGRSVASLLRLRRQRGLVHAGDLKRLVIEIRFRPWGHRRYVVLRARLRPAARRPHRALFGAAGSVVAH